MRQSSWNVSLRGAASSVLAAALVLGIAGTTEGTAGPTGLVAAYNFNEGAGTTVNDLSGNRNNGTIVGATWSASGKYGKALSFDATKKNYVSIADAPSLHLGSGMTLEAWVDPSTLGNGNGSWRTVVYKERPASVAYALFANNGGSRPDAQVYLSAVQNASGAAQLSLNKWTHLAATYDGSSLKLYVNGVQASSVSATGAIVSSTGLLKIGGNSISNQWYGGLIDEMRVYNRALSASEIQTDMTTPVTSAPDTTPPSMPTSFVQSGSTPTSIATAWTASTDNVGVTGYGVYVNGALVASTTATAYTFSGLTCGTSYTLGVDAVDAAGNRSAQAPLVASTAACDTTPPTVQITSPADLSSVTGSVPVSANASDNVAVAGVQFQVDGVNIGAEDVTAPYSVTWDTATAPVGTHTLTAVARDTSGNTATSAVNVTVFRDVTAPTAPTNLAVTSTTTTSIAVAWSPSTDDVGVAGYGMYNGGATPAATTAATNYIFTSLLCGTTYTLGVDAFDAAGNRSSQTQIQAATGACPTAVGLVAAYAFNEGSGTTVNDLSGTGNNGTISGATWSSSGKFGGALVFNGSNSLVTVPESASLDLTTGMTLEAWVDPSQLGTAWRNVVFKEQPTDMVYALYASNGTRPDGQVYFGGAEHNVLGSSAVALNTWTHLATTFDGSSLKLYVNGGLVSSVALSGTILRSSGVLHIGGDSVWGEWFAGLLDEIRIYNRALSASEIQSDMNTPLGAQDTTPPTAPSNLTAAGSLGSAQLTWSASTDNVGVTRYNVYRGAISGFTPSAGNQVGTAASTAYTDSGLPAGTYYYRVTAQDAAGNVSAPSNEASAAVTADTTPPSVSVTSPTDGSSVSNTVTVTASASDNVGVAGVQFKLDGANLGSEVLAAPYSILWSTSTASNGPHTLTAVARDGSGNTATSATVTVTVSNAPVVTPIPVPEASVNGITVGDGFVDASEREAVRTPNNVVYVVAADDDPCQGKATGKGVIHIWKGIGAQPGNASVPTSFVEQDAANRPVPAGSGDCTFSSTNGSPVLSSPDIRLDKNGVIHLVYIDESIGSGVVYYQTYSTATDTWGARTAIASNGMQYNGLGWPRFGMVALTLDTADVPHVVYCTSGTSNQIMYTDKTSGSWSTPVTVFSGTNEMHPSLVTAVDGTLHLAWLDNALATHSAIKYAHYSLGAWSAVETVSAGDTLVLANGDNDQSPSIATDGSSRPHVSYLDGTVNSGDNYVRMRYRTASGVWTDDTPPGGAGGPSNPNGTWFTHTPQNYVSSTNDDFVFLGHDVNISPGGYEYQTGGPGNNWSPYATIDPRNSTNTTAGEPGIDGSASVRFDPLRDNNPGIIDVLYFDENDGTAGYAHHATVFYKALIIK